MFCDELLELIDAIASGDVTPDSRMRAHLSSCGGCAAALDDARSVDALLRARPVPPPPPQFTARIMGRIRRDRWRRDQFLDVGFNVVVGLIVFGMLAVVWTVLSQSGLGSMSRDAFGILNAAAASVVRRIAPSLPVYAAAAALLATALGVWWWAERDAAL